MSGRDRSPPPEYQIEWARSYNAERDRIRVTIPGEDIPLIPTASSAAAVPRGNLQYDTQSQSIGREVVINPALESHGQQQVSHDPQLSHAAQVPQGPRFSAYAAPVYPSANLANTPNPGSAYYSQNYIISPPNMQSGVLPTPPLPERPPFSGTGEKYDDLETGVTVYLCTRDQVSGFQPAPGQEDIQEGRASKPKKEVVDKDEKYGNCSRSCWSVMMHSIVLALLGIVIWHNIQGFLFYYIYTTFLISLGICWLLLMLEVVSSNTFKYLRNMRDKIAAVKKIHDVRKVVPVLKFDLEVYCYNSKPDQSEYIIKDNIDPSRFLRPNPNLERTILLKTRSEFKFKECIDISTDPDILELDQGAFTVSRVEFISTYGFYDEFTEFLFEQHKQELIDKAKAKGPCFVLKQEYEMKYDDKVAIHVAKSPPCLMDLLTFCCISLCLMTWPYRWIFWTCTKKRKFTYAKLLKI